MNCTNKQQETAECEKRGCEGCFYNQKVDDLTTVYMSGFYDGEKKWKDKIKAKIENIKEDEDFYREQDRMYEYEGKIKILHSLLEREEKENEGDKV